MPHVTTTKSVPIHNPKEGSILSSKREKDDVGQSWKVAKAQREQLQSLLFSQEQLVRQMEKMRRRILGGAAAAAVGGYTREYDPLKVYSAGETFKISTPLTITIASVNYVIAAGYWGVGPAATAVDSQGFGPFAGSLPANPTTAGIDIDKMFFNPENTLPTMGAAPNDKLYADLIFSSCGNA